MKPRRPRCDGGGAAVELTLAAPLLILLLLFVVALGRLSESRLQVDDAAAQAARAATLVPDVGQASSQATAAATGALAGDGVTCRDLSVATDTTNLTPGGSVTVVVHCNVSLSDLSLLHVPGSTTLTSTATSPVDQFRGVSP